jgi:ATP-dependent Clp protease ATP-binding subunit ClpC
VELPLAPESKRVLHYAHEESDRLSDRHIGTEHMLLGLMRRRNHLPPVLMSWVRLNTVRESLAQNGRRSVTPPAQGDRWMRRDDFVSFSGQPSA